MVQGISGRAKRYVSVTARVDEDGRVRPLSIQWYDGRTYAIDDVRDVRRSSSRKVGGDGICYTIRIGERVTRWTWNSPDFVDTSNLRKIRPAEKKGGLQCHRFLQKSSERRRWNSI
ncbi:hypothetical protein, partial [Xiamenia xianingshaonis]|uniref:hypothetical protein n=1 Tax=Xiamenia xianingshaonis TaxID=2682776 RepID=UPI0021BD9FA7